MDILELIIRFFGKVLRKIKRIPKKIKKVNKKFKKKLKSVKKRINKKLKPITKPVKKFFKKFKKKYKKFCKKLRKKLKPITKPVKKFFKKNKKKHDKRVAARKRKRMARKNKFNASVKGAKQLYANLHNEYWMAKRKYIHYYETLAIKEDTILLEASHGDNVNGNMFYIAKYLCTSEEYKDYKIYFTARGRYRKKYENFFARYGIENIHVITLASDEYFRVLNSAKYLFNDTTFNQYFTKKDGQVYFNTWHGTPLKALGRSIQNEPHAIGNVQKNFVAADYLLYPNEYTRDIMLRDYMLENIASGAYVMSGYPRNEVFLDEERRETVREELGFEDKRIYAYMPTFRGTVSAGGTSKNSYYLNFYLYEIDRQLGENEEFYVNLHPLAQKDVNFRNFKRIKTFPAGYETYDFLNAADVLITDYSSVFFDYAISRQKIVQFVYDKEEYLQDRGMYMSLDTLPFPQAATVDELLCALRSEKDYDDTAFLEQYCCYDRKDTSKQICDYVILGKENGMTPCKIPNNGKENVLIYAGNLAGNGITASLRNLLNSIDLEKRNYYFSFYTHVAKAHKEAIHTFPEKANFYGLSGDANYDVIDLYRRRRFLTKKCTAERYMKFQEKRIQQNLYRLLGGAKFDQVIQFNGYESEVILMFSTFKGPKTIYVHSDMVQEIATKHNQREDVLNYAYNHYDHVAIVTEDMIEPTSKLAKNKERFAVSKNLITYQTILEKAELELEFDSYTKTTIPQEEIRAILDSDAECFINVGRFAPEKGHDRLIDAFAKYHESHPNSYLFIMGGYSLNNLYTKLSAKVQKMEIQDHVILIEKMSNPYPFIKACDAFVLSSHYESFGLVLAEADILGLPVISVDIPGPRGFMNKYGGTMVANSEEGILHGLELLHSGAVKHMNVDYAKYNQEAIAEFEAILANDR